MKVQFVNESSRALPPELYSMSDGDAINDLLAEYNLKVVKFEKECGTEDTIISKTYTVGDAW